MTWHQSSCVKNRHKSSTSTIGVVPNGSTRVMTRISTATRDMTDPTLLFCAKYIPPFDRRTESFERPKMQASSRHRQKTYIDADEDMPEGLMEDDSTSGPPEYWPQESTLSRAPDYRQVVDDRPEAQWQPYHWTRLRDELESASMMLKRGEYGLKPPYRFGTHPKYPLAPYHSILSPLVMIIESESKVAHKALTDRHNALIMATKQALSGLRDVVNIDPWHLQVPFPTQ